MKNPILLTTFPNRKINPDSMLGKLKAEAIERDHPYLTIYFADFMKDHPIPGTETVIDLPITRTKDQERTAINIFQQAIYLLSRESLVISHDWIYDRSSMIAELDSDILWIFSLRLDLNSPFTGVDDYHFFNFLKAWFDDLIIKFIHARGDDAVYDYWPNYYYIFQQTLYSAGLEYLDKGCLEYLKYLRPGFPEFFDN